jgi:uncharacterized protein
LIRQAIALEKLFLGKSKFTGPYQCRLSTVGVFSRSRVPPDFMCSPLSPSGDATDRSVRTGRAGVATADARPVSIKIGPIRWPGYLDRQEIIIRVEPNRFKILEDDRWAEPLDENFLRVLMQNLSVSPRTDQIFIYPWPRNKKLSV